MQRKMSRVRSMHNISKATQTLMLAAVLLAAHTGICAGQDRAPNHDESLPSFEAALVKPTDPGNIAGGQWSFPGGSTFRATGLSLEFFTAMAYNIDASQIKGAPSWF